MKKTFITGISVLLAASQVLFAIPAKKGTFRKIQPDGSVITLERHGDEFYHWTTDESGNVVALDANGIYQVSSMPTEEQLGGRAAAWREATLLQARKAAARQRAPKAGYTTYHFPVVLVQFKNQSFDSNTANDDFSRLLNEQGYADNGATGSVHDYYWENSMGTFYAVFDVYGPYTYNGTVADNAEEDDAAKILWAAIKAYDSSVDWGQYDNDGDGKVDMVFMYYAGWNEAEGEDNTIWPHKYDFSSAGVTTSTLDGKSFDIYACTSERSGTSTNDGGMCGIGTCAHEFSHTQGLPDFYDTNYNNYGDGESGATYEYDIMCSGAYNNAGRTPPYFNAEERIMMGWMDGLSTMPSSGDITIPAVNTNFAYKLQTSNVTGGKPYADEEYFIFETRPGTGWDAPLEPGLVVYHVDKSSKYSISFYFYSSSYHPTMTGYNLWYPGTSSYRVGLTTYSDFTQFINANGNHPCFYIVPAADQDNLNYGNVAKLPFPGKSGMSYYAPVDWAGNTYDLFSSISFHSNNSTVTMHRGENYKGVCGFVTNSSGKAVSGAEVNIYATSTRSSSNTIQKISGRVPGNLRYSVTTDENGYYGFDLSALDNATVDIEVVARGYITKYVSVAVSDELVTKNFKLRSIDEPIDYTLKKYDRSQGGLYVLGYGETCTTYGSICFSADDLEDFVGRKILKLGFAYDMDEDSSVSGVYGLIDFGATRKLTSKVSSPEPGWNEIDVSGENLYVPSGEDCYFGYALVRCTYGYPMVYSDNDPQDGGFNYSLSSSTSVSTSAVSWSSLSYGNLLVYVILDDSSEVDYNYIYNPGYGEYTVGDTFALTLVEAEGDRKPGSAIAWYFDDEPVSGESIVLKYAGHHLVEARFTTKEGKTKVVELELNVGL